MPDRMLIGCGASVGFLAASFFLSGMHHELRHQLWMWRRQRRRGGWIV